NKDGNPYSNTYNPDWGDHPNLRWGGNQWGGNNSNQEPQDRTNPSDHTACGQRLDRIEEEMQSMRTDAKQIQSKCTNSTRTFTKLEDQMSQLMSMMGDIKRQIGIGIPSNTEDNARREGKEHVKAIALRPGKVLGSPKIPIPEVTVDNTMNLKISP
ncbi:hypothetical protein V6Z11_D09G085400, partial [Gossypium hirsutum]